MSGCEWAEPRLDAWLDGELEPEQARRVMAHVERCAACERRRRLLLETSALLRGLGADLLGSPRPTPRRWARRLGFVAAAAALIALGVGLLWPKTSGSGPALAEDCAHCGPEPFPRPSASGTLAEKP